MACKQRRRRRLRRRACFCGALFLVFIVQIVARFGFNRPLPWTDELAVILYVWP